MSDEIDEMNQTDKVIGIRSGITVEGKQIPHYQKPAFVKPPKQLELIGIEGARMNRPRDISKDAWTCRNLKLAPSYVNKFLEFGREKARTETVPNPTSRALSKLHPSVAPIYKMNLESGQSEIEARKVAQLRAFPSLYDYDENLTGWGSLILDAHIPVQVAILSSALFRAQCHPDYTYQQYRTAATFILEAAVKYLAYENQQDEVILSLTRSR